MGVRRVASGRVYLSERNARQVRFVAREPSPTCLHDPLSSTPYHRHQKCYLVCSNLPYQVGSRNCLPRHSYTGGRNPRVVLCTFECQFGGIDHCSEQHDIYNPRVVHDLTRPHRVSYANVVQKGNPGHLRTYFTDIWSNDGMLPA